MDEEMSRAIEEAEAARALMAEAEITVESQERQPSPAELDGEPVSLATIYESAHLTMFP